MNATAKPIQFDQTPSDQALFNQIPSSRHSIFGKFMLLITIIIVPLFLAVGWFTFKSFDTITTQQQLQSLESLAKEKANTINQYIDNHSGRVETLAMMPFTQSALPAFTSAFQQEGIDSAAYHQTHSDYTAFFEGYLSHWNYYDLFLIDPQGHIVYSIKHESDFATNLQTGLYKDSGLGQVFQQSIALLQTNNSTFTYYPPSKEAAAFIATPVIRDGHMIGVVALQFDTDAFYDVINDLTGLGDSGEIVVGQIVNDHILLTAPLRHDADAAFKRTIALDADNALPIREGAQGTTGSGIIIDWRGEEVLAVWQHIPALKWGMVLKIDTQEGLAHRQDIVKNLMAIVGLGLLISYLLIFLFTRNLVLPLRKLTQASLDFAAGKQDIQLDSIFTIKNEAGALAKAFAGMIQRIQTFQLELESTVEALAENNRTLDQRVREQTEHIQAIVQYSADGIITMNQQGKIESVNPAICHMFGYAEEELIGQAMTKLMPEKYRDAHTQALSRYTSSGSTSSINLSVELEGMRKSGEVFPLDLNINEMHVGTHMLFLGRMLDLTEDNIKREKLEHTQRLESLGVLAGGIAHDFNNLLTAILGNAGLARRKIDRKSPAIQMLDNIETASERAAALCKQMLAYSGKGKFVVEAINLTELIEEMMKLLEVSMQKNIVMRLNLSKQLPLIEADASQMQQVIMNLVINASEAIENKSGSVTIHTGVVDMDDDYIQTTYMDDKLLPGRYIAIEVSDTGCGMDDHTKKHLFDPFFTTKFTGRGLGMSAILGIVRGHKGAIKLYSEVGKGTTFKILFPCSEYAENKHKEALTNHPTRQGFGTILIVDDEETIRATAGMMLEDIGFTIITANDGVEGVEVFREKQAEIRAVLLDMTMPRMNGEEVFREIRMMQPDIKVILSSGYNEQDATNRFAGKGLAGFIQKPYSLSALQGKVLDILD